MVSTLRARVRPLVVRSFSDSVRPVFPHTSVRRTPVLTMPSTTARPPACSVRFSFVPFLHARVALSENEPSDPNSDLFRPSRREICVDAPVVDACECPNNGSANFRLKTSSLGTIQTRARKFRTATLTALHRSSRKVGLAGSDPVFGGNPQRPSSVSTRARFSRRHSSGPIRTVVRVSRDRADQHECARPTRRTLFEPTWQIQRNSQRTLKLCRV